MGNMETIPPQTAVNGISINTDLETGPYFLDGCDTLPKLFLQRCKELGERTSHTPG
jgi:long-chain acyl-CoA synthetase